MYLTHANKWDKIDSKSKGFEFKLKIPEVSFLKFIVYDRDTTSKDDKVAYAYIPFNYIRTGFRTVPLKPFSSEDSPTEDSYLFVHLSVKNI